MQIQVRPRGALAVNHVGCVSPSFFAHSFKNGVIRFRSNFFFSKVDFDLATSLFARPARMTPFLNRFAKELEDRCPI
jgi:hypothetical protein